MKYSPGEVTAKRAIRSLASLRPSTASIQRGPSTVALKISNVEPIVASSVDSVIGICRERKLGSCISDSMRVIGKLAQSNQLVEPSKPLPRTHCGHSQ